MRRKENGSSSESVGFFGSILEAVCEIIAAICFFWD